MAELRWRRALFAIFAACVIALATTAAQKGIPEVQSPYVRTQDTLARQQATDGAATDGGAPSPSLPMPPATPGPTWPTFNGFIRAVGTHFADEDCKDYVIAGFNAWELMEQQMGATDFQFEYPGKSEGTPQEALRFLLDTAQRNGLNVVRMFAGTGSGTRALLQQSPGNYNEPALRALDKVIDEIAKRGMRVILSFADNWGPGDSKMAYGTWCGLDQDPDQFWTSDCAKGFYKNHIAFLTGHTNSVRGLKYKDDPAILAWNLINEPRCYKADEPTGACEGAMQDWFDEMAEFTKQVDPNHMVTVGEEGFFSRASCNRGANPAQWANTQSSQSFSKNHASPHIDFMGFHMWPDNWDMTSLEFADMWINSHIEAAQNLNKPLLLEEFGRNVEVSGDYTGNYREEGSETKERTPYYKHIYGLVEDSIQKGLPLRGAMFWRLNVQKSDFKMSPEDVYYNDETLKQAVLPFTTRLATAAPLVENCTPGKGSDTGNTIRPDEAGIPYPDELVSQCSGQYGLLQGNTISSFQTLKVEECCARCRATQGCNAWSWNACPNDLEYSQNTCLLQALQAPGFPVLTFDRTSSQHGDWVNALTDKLEMQPTVCQPKGGACGTDWQGCPNLMDVLECADENKCGKMSEAETWYTGDDVDGYLITLDENSNIENKSDKITTAAQCCQACKDNGDCNTWVFNHRPTPVLEGEGCKVVQKQAEEDGADAYGEYGGCQDNSFPPYQCLLFKFNSDPPLVSAGNEGMNIMAKLNS